MMSAIDVTRAIVMPITSSSDRSITFPFDRVFVRLSYRAAGAMPKRK
jgi:hypothetical protein